MRSICLTQYAGGNIVVGVTELSAEGVTVVALNTPTVDLPLLPDEARWLAVALIEKAALAEFDAG